MLISKGDMNDWSVYWTDIKMWLAKINWASNSFGVFEFTVEHFMWRS